MITRHLVHGQLVLADGATGSGKALTKGPQPGAQSVAYGCWSALIRAGAVGVGSSLVHCRVLLNSLLVILLRCALTGMWSSVIICKRGCRVGGRSVVSCWPGTGLLANWPVRLSTRDLVSLFFYGDFVGYGGLGSLIATA